MKVCQKGGSTISPPAAPIPGHVYRHLRYPSAWLYNDEGYLTSLTSGIAEKVTALSNTVDGCLDKGYWEDITDRCCLEIKR